eukprot:3397365-Prymnesium_polylepis.1
MEASVGDGRIRRTAGGARRDRLLSPRTMRAHGSTRMVREDTSHLRRVAHAQRCQACPTGTARAMTLANLTVPRLSQKMSGRRGGSARGCRMGGGNKACRMAVNSVELS